MMSFSSLLFYILALLALLSAIGVIASRNPMYSALSLVASLFAVAVLYLLLNAEFLAIIQVLTYAGAILVLFLFIIMLLNLQPSELREKGPGTFIKMGITSVAVFAFVSLAWVVRFPELGFARVGSDFGSVASLGRELFTRYVIPLEISAVLLTVALIGAVLLAKKTISGKK